MLPVVRAPLKVNSWRWNHPAVHCAERTTLLRWQSKRKAQTSATSCSTMCLHHLDRPPPWLRSASRCSVLKDGHRLLPVCYANDLLHEL